MRLFKDEYNYRITCTKEFRPNQIDIECIKEVFDFSFEMAFGKGFHRKHRSGGEYLRNNIELFTNVFQGKLAEMVLYDILSKSGLQLAKPDFTIYGKGKWDETDLRCNNKNINIKSGAFFSNLLLLEAKDWTKNGEYIPNQKGREKYQYDFFVFVRIYPNFKTKLPYNTNEIVKENFKKTVLSLEWSYDIAGVCTHKTLKYIIEKEYILPKGALLNGKIKMDASNYYIQSGSLKSVNYLIDELKKATI